MAATKKKDWADLLGGTKTATVATAEKPKEPPVTVLMHTIVGNPDNPRPEEDYSDNDPEFRELKASMKEIGQLQPLAVVSRAVFENAKPDALAKASPKTRKLISEAEWVVVTGNRRLAAARQLGWTRIDIRVQDQLGDEEGRIDEAVIIENIHRKNLAPIKEAEYLRAMVERHGSQERVAERIGKSQMFVSQRLALLNLAPDIKEEVEAGTLKIKEARQIARTPNHEEQRARVAELKAKAAAPKPRVREPEPSQNRVLKTTQEPTPPPAPAGGQNPVLEPPADTVKDQPLEGIPEPREAATEPPGQPVLRKFPYDDGRSAAGFLIERMPPQEFQTMLELLLEHQLKITEARR
jgi:ParB family chromosome partitioning protein